VVWFSLARYLPPSYAPFRIFIRHHDMLCLACGGLEADSGPSRAIGVGLCRILDANFREFSFHALR
jgi:hypothetical protein